MRMSATILLGLAFVGIAAALASATDDPGSAREILKAAGRDQGLCVVLGCGREQSPALLAELASQSRMLVHGLAFDAASLARAKAAIQAKDVPGRAVAECVELKPLPYVNDLANIVVLEDPSALTSKGVTMDDVLRVVAPEGAVVSLKNGKWTADIKPRPTGMDEWAHVHHDAGDTMVSNDKVLRFPIGLRWIDGLPKNINRWASVRGWIISGGRCFALSSSEVENLGGKKKDHYLVARDAFNGLPLWKLNCETTDDGAALFWLNAGPLAADGKHVYAVKKDKPVSVDAATGQIAFTFPTKYPPVRILVHKEVFVAVCWDGKEASKSPLVNGSLWATWVNKSANGSVEAFDTKTGAPKWSLPVTAQCAQAAGDTVYVLAQTGNPPTAQEVIAVDIQTGKERWRMDHTKFGSDPDLQLSVAGAGFVIVTKRRSESVAILSEKDGHVTWEDKIEVKADAKPGQTPWLWTPIVDGLLWYKNQKRDPLTGEVKGRAPTWIPNQGCTPSVLVGNIVTQSRGCTYIEFPEKDDPNAKAKTFAFRAARGACMEGMVPANGMLYTAQNNCQCAPGQLLGFLAFGPNGPELTPADFEQARPIEQGPAFGKVESAATAEPGWPMYRADAARASATAAAVPEKIALTWHTPLAKDSDAPLAQAWKARLEQLLTPPVASGGIVVTAACESGEVFACDAASGKAAWRVLLGGRIDSAPTLYKGYCFAGCHDGWVYALRAKDGQLAWRTRVAPLERRMVVQGQVESIWPAVGTVAVQDGVLFVDAGRGSEADGGVAVMALEPATGKAIWSKCIAPGPQHRNDLLRVEANAVVWNDSKLDPKTGGPAAGAEKSKGAYMDPILDENLMGMGFRLDKRDLHAWNATLKLQAGGGCSAFPPPSAPAPKAEPGKPAPAPVALWSVKFAGGVNLTAVGLGTDRAVVAGTLNGQPGGHVWVLSLKDGAITGEAALPSPPVYDGLAIAGGKIFLALQNGELCGLDAQK